MALAFSFIAVDGRWPIDARVSLAILVPLIVVLCWSLACWLTIDAFHPQRGWLRSEGKLGWFFPWLRVLLVIVLAALILAPALLWVTS